MKKIKIVKINKNDFDVDNYRTELLPYNDLVQFINNIHPDVLKEVSFLRVMHYNVNHMIKLTTKMKSGIDAWYKNDRITINKFEEDKIKLAPIIEKLDNFYKYIQAKFSAQTDDKISAKDIYTIKNYLDGLKRFHSISKNILYNINIIYKKYQE